MRQLLVRGAAALTMVLSAVPALAQDGRSLVETRCASCHDASDARTPSLASLRERSPSAILDALTTGAMREQGRELSAVERRVIAEYLSGRTVASTLVPSPASLCVSPPPFEGGVRWGGWSPDLANTRFQPNPGLTAEQVPGLTLKWAFGFPDAANARGLPTVAFGRVFVGSQRGVVYALDAKTGCTIWTFVAAAGVRSGIVIGPGAGPAPAIAYFGDGRATVYAVNAATGTLLWSKKVEDHPNANITGTPALYQNRLYIPVASGEEGQGNNAKYECCTFRGSVVALDAASGALIWKTYTIANEPRPLGRNRSGTTRMGPSGAGIWASPTVDAKRRLLYAATGNMYTEPQQTTSDAVIAFSLATGQVVWTSQLTPKDVFVVGCGGTNPSAANCGDDVGPDFDFGNAAMLVTRTDGKDLLVIGQKSGVGWALDPDRQGAVVWQYRAGNGSALGGMEFGSATDGERVYFPVADANGAQAGEMHAVDLLTGQRIWMTPPPAPKCGTRARGCTPAILAAVTAVPGAVLAGAQDGGLRAYSTATGAVIWEYDTNREFRTVNGVTAKGASMSGPGPIVAGGMVFVGSGYGALGGRPGNVLLAFGVD
ncbi:MAG TPA: PQQ-binding-like beta-propeller repeat protein [Vicinamibacterales bacterium]|nr:PQQ-binding-like beta-propeller repeat protein [Vicinamibacterales bacterium]